MLLSHKGAFHPRSLWTIEKRAEMHTIFETRYDAMRQSEAPHSKED